MSYTIRITPLAKSQITKAKGWYDGQSAGLGERFKVEIEQHIDSLIDETIEHKIVFESIRRILLHKFPYIIYYKRYKAEKLITIMSVLHTKQNPPTF